MDSNKFREIRNIAAANWVRTSMIVVCGCSADGVFAQDENVAFSELSGRVIENVFVEAEDVFDIKNEEEDNWLFDIANRLHVDTRPRTITTQLLLAPGDKLSLQKLQESERILRGNAYLFDASITPVEKQNGSVDLLVKTRDNWTLFPEFSFSRAGGESESSFGIEEKNLLGTGTSLNVRREKDDDRTSSVFEFSGRSIGEHRLRARYGFANLSDGETQRISVQRPFFSLDTLWAGGASAFLDDRIESLYSRGQRAARYRKDQQLTTGFVGRSDGLQDGVAQRWITGYVADENIFDPVVQDDLALVVPQNRRLNYPFLRYQQIEDKFQETTNLNQIGRTEDLSLGAEYQFTLGYASEAFGSDRNAWIFGAQYQKGYGSPDNTLVVIGNSISGRIESGSLRNTMFNSQVELYRRRGEKQLFYAAASLVRGKNLDLDNYSSLGGETGLRGYPMDFLNAEKTLLMNLEYRFYTDYYPFRLFRVGAAVFFDAARGWGADTLGRNADDVLSNVGFGLRFASMRSSSNRVFHFDVAFPTSGGSELDTMQFQITGKRRF